MFDSIIKEAREKFNLGDKAVGLLSALLTLMTDKTGGGFGGFLERFNTAGLGGLATSWMSSGANTPISNEQTESAYGEETLAKLSESVGLDYDTTTAATAFMTPHIVDALTPDGEIPTENDLSARIGDFLSGIGTSATGAFGTANAAANDVVDRIGTAAAGTAEAGRSAVGDLINTVGTKAEIVEDRADDSLNRITGAFDSDDDGDNSFLKWLIPLLLLGLLVILGFLFCGKSTTPIVSDVNSDVNKVVPKAANINQ